jgi:hypothetical protein
MIFSKASIFAANNVLTGFTASAGKCSRLGFVLPSVQAISALGTGANDPGNITYYPVDAANPESQASLDYNDTPPDFKGVVQAPTLPLYYTAERCLTYPYAAGGIFTAVLITGPLWGTIIQYGAYIVGYGTPAVGTDPWANYDLLPTPISAQAFNLYRGQQMIFFSTTPSYTDGSGTWTTLAEMRRNKNPSDFAWYPL